MLFIGTNLMTDILLFLLSKREYEILEAPHFQTLISHSTRQLDTCNKC